jgi:predicted metal-dependent hydrolase
MIKKKPPAQPVLLGKYDITLDQETISYTLKRSYRARLVWLNIKPTGLTVTVPRNYNITRLADYLKSKSAWILRNLNLYCQASPAPVTVNSFPTNTISYLGKSLHVIADLHSGKDPVKMVQDTLIVNLNSQSAALLALQLECWLKARATELIRVKVHQFSLQMGLVYNRIVIRDQKSRWGSCSVLKNLNFNWRLIMAPEPVMDYVIVHEICHLREMSHSRSFWELVAEYCPHWQEYRTWLRKHSLELHAQPQLSFNGT